MIPNAGHAPFWDQTERFNAELRSFCQSHVAHAFVET
jgi:pimeloyl-ACP methyl ester carboxylesterase